MRGPIKLHRRFRGRLGHVETEAVLRAEFLVVTPAQRRQGLRNVSLRLGGMYKIVAEGIQHHGAALGYDGQ